MNVRTVRALKDNYCYLVTDSGIGAGVGIRSTAGAVGGTGVGAPAGGFTGDLASGGVRAAAGSETRSSDVETRSAVVVDPSEAAPIMTALRDLGLKLGLILNTHHHHDHVGGNLELVEHWGCPVYCSARDFDRVPGATRGLSDGDTFSFGSLTFSVLAIPGHTEGQIAYHADDALFVGDTVFEMGCGRLFEGTPAQMFTSLARIQSLPETTRLYFGHEYTEVNARFALDVDPANRIAINERLEDVRAQLLRTGHATAPTLAAEKKVNPFFRARTLEDFTHLRERRNSFQ
jgi:hydroxyacylglutathione hydrolase